MSTDMVKKKILIVEDDSFIVKAYQIRFERDNFDVSTVMTGADALRFLDRAPVDIVLLDLMLPGVSGFDVLEAIRKSKTWKDVPVVILSNLGQAEDIRRGKELGATDYIVKANARINEVADKIKQYL